MDCLCLVGLPELDAHLARVRAIAATTDLLALDRVTASALRRHGLAHALVWDSPGSAHWDGIDGPLHDLWLRVAAPDLLGGVPISDLWGHFAVAEAHRAFAFTRAAGAALAARKPGRCLLFVDDAHPDAGSLRWLGPLLETLGIPWQKI